MGFFETLHVMQFCSLLFSPDKADLFFLSFVVVVVVAAAAAF